MELNDKVLAVLDALQPEVHGRLVLQVLDEAGFEIVEKPVEKESLTAKVKKALK